VINRFEDPPGEKLMDRVRMHSYDRTRSVVFLKTKEEFGGLSNMAAGFPLLVNKVSILTSEALYQACRFPHLPDVQAKIIGAKSPMTAKMTSKPHRRDSRPDWDEVRVEIMRWCLRAKLAQNWDRFGKLLLKTSDRPIVEESSRDPFWGAKPIDPNTLVGMNVLGQLLMELREAVRSEGPNSLMSVRPLAIPDFLLVGRPIQEITSLIPERDRQFANRPVPLAREKTQRSTAAQQLVLDFPATK
jgi:type I restriction enzyme S subunit